MDISPWSSLEKAKLAVSILTPLLVLILGIVINNSVKTAERSSGLRSEIYKQIGGDLNDIYSYLAFVGGWKNLTPAEVIESKRAVDKAMDTSWDPAWEDRFTKERNKEAQRQAYDQFPGAAGSGLEALNMETPNLRSSGPPSAAAELKR